MRLHLSIAATLAAATLIQGLALEWTPVASEVTARLRGVSVASDRVVWASGAEGTVVRTADGGVTWQRPRVPADRLPRALPNEGAFAASGTNVTTYGASHVWIGTGGAAKARVLRSADGGQTWQVSETPLAAGVIAIGPAGADYSRDAAARGASWVARGSMRSARRPTGGSPSASARTGASGCCGSDVRHLCDTSESAAS